MLDLAVTKHFDSHFVRAARDGTVDTVITLCVGYSEIRSTRRLIDSDHGSTCYGTFLVGNTAGNR